MVAGVRFERTIAVYETAVLPGFTIPRCRTKTVTAWKDLPYGARVSRRAPGRTSPGLNSIARPCRNWEAVPPARKPFVFLEPLREVRIQEQGDSAGSRNERGLSVGPFLNRLSPDTPPLKAKARQFGYWVLRAARGLRRWERSRCRASNQAYLHPEDGELDISKRSFQERKEARCSREG